MVDSKNVHPESPPTRIGSGCRMGVCRAIPRESGPHFEKKVYSLCGRLRAHFTIPHKNQWIRTKNLTKFVLVVQKCNPYRTFGSASNPALDPNPNPALDPDPDPALDPDPDPDPKTTIQTQIQP